VREGGGHGGRMVGEPPFGGCIHGR
jgi:hypothetical protein